MWHIGKIYNIVQIVSGVRYEIFAFLKTSFQLSRYFSIMKFSRFFLWKFPVVRFKTKFSRFLKETLNFPVFSNAISPFFRTFIIFRFFQIKFSCFYISIKFSPSVLDEFFSDKIFTFSFSDEVFLLEKMRNWIWIFCWLNGLMSLLNCKSTVFKI